MDSPKLAPFRIGPFLAGPRFDLFWLLGPAALSLLLVLPALFGYWPHADTPTWAWLVLVLAVDVSHVWASLYRVYLDAPERRRRPWLYGLTPVLVYLGATLVYAIDPALFWTTLAYLAVYHFIRQQIGFVAIYRGLAAERAPLVRRLDHLAVYTGTLVPIAWWHCHLPRRFDWFMPHDFIGPWPLGLMDLLWPVYIAVALTWLAHRVHTTLTTRVWNAGKDLTMLATWTLWGVGIVGLNSDFAFTATNVLLHGIPYMALVWLVGRRRADAPNRPSPGALFRWLLAPRRAWAFFGLLLAIATVEEWLWDAFVWRDHPQIFGAWSTPTAAWVALVFVPLLTVPQVTHYILDGFIWRFDNTNPGLKALLSPQISPSAPKRDVLSPSPEPPPSAN